MEKNKIKQNLFDLMVPVNAPIQQYCPVYVLLFGGVTKEIGKLLYLTIKKIPTFILA